MSLPHVVARFYANIDGRAVRRTTLGVLVLLSVFYRLPTVDGVLGRSYSFQLVADGRTDAVVLELPTDVLHGFGADLLTGLLRAGAFAAFRSTSSGLAVSVAGVVSQDMLRGRSDSVRGFRLATALVLRSARRGRSADRPAGRMDDSAQPIRPTVRRFFR